MHTLQQFGYTKRKLYALSYFITVKESAYQDITAPDNNTVAREREHITKTAVRHWRFFVPGSFPLVPFCFEAEMLTRAISRPKYKGQRDEEMSSPCWAVASSC